MSYVFDDHSHGASLIYISIDGDDIGRRVTARHLSNDVAGLTALVQLVHDKVHRIEHLLIESGYQVIFCAADGVVACNHGADEQSAKALYPDIREIGGEDLKFSAGVGPSLRKAYVALLAAKSNGKARVCAFSELD